MLIHATVIAIDGRAVLFTGPSLSGKSDLALRAIADGAALIADDVVEIQQRENGLAACRLTDALPRLAVRGIGIIAPESVTDAALVSLCVALDPQRHAMTLQPDLAKAGPWHGQYVPQITLNPFEASAVAKLHLALTRFGF